MGKAEKTKRNIQMSMRSCSLFFFSHSSGVRLSRQQKAIQDATRSVAETEEVGATILQDLDGNRNKILDAHGKVSKMAFTTVSFRLLLNGIVGCNIKQRSRPSR